VIVDEAAALPVRLLEGFLDAPAVAFCTTVHGYEGAGRGFAIRFKERLRASPFAVRDVRLDEPIRYARNDPVEAWASRALLLDARPAVDEAVAGSAVGDATYRRLTPDELLADEALLREAFGLLVAAHYRTEPNDLARLLDAPNLAARALVAEGRVVAVALLARGGQARRGNPPTDVRGRARPRQHGSGRAHEPAPRRDRRRAVWPADGPDRDSPRTQRRGFGTRLLDEVHEEFGEGGGGARTATAMATPSTTSVGYGARPRACSASGGGRATGRSTSRPPVTTPPGNTPRSCFGRPARTDREVASSTATPPPSATASATGSRTPTATWTPMWSPARFEPVPRRCRST